VIDRELVTRKIVRISGDLEELRKFDSAGLDAYLADPYKEILAERFLERGFATVSSTNTKRSSPKKSSRRSAPLSPTCRST